MLWKCYRCIIFFFTVNLFYLFVFTIIVYKSFDWCKIKIIPFKNNVLLIIVYYISKFLELIGSAVLLKEKKNFFSCTIKLIWPHGDGWLFIFLFLYITRHFIALQYVNTLNGLMGPTPRGLESFYLFIYY